jgi:peroxiredoxin
MIWALLAAVSVAAPAAAVQIGAPVPEFGTTALDGARISLAEAVGGHKAVVIVFLSTVCPYANAFGDHLRELDAKYALKGALFVGVYSNRTESTEEVAANAREHGYAFAVVKDTGNRIADLLDARRTPEAFIVDAAGRLRYRGRVRSKLGSTDLADALDAVLADRPLRRAEAKAFGCAIVRE